MNPSGDDTSHLLCRAAMLQPLRSLFIRAAVSQKQRILASKLAWSRSKLLWRSQLWHAPSLGVSTSEDSQAGLLRASRGGRSIFGFSSKRELLASEPSRRRCVEQCWQQSAVHDSCREHQTCMANELESTACSPKAGQGCAVETAGRGVVVSVRITIGGCKASRPSAVFSL